MLFKLLLMIIIIISLSGGLGATVGCLIVAIFSKTKRTKYLRYAKTSAIVSAISLVAILVWPTETSTEDSQQTLETTEVDTKVDEVCLKPSERMEQLLEAFNSKGEMEPISSLTDKCLTEGEPVIFNWNGTTITLEEIQHQFKLSVRFSPFTSDEEERRFVFDTFAQIMGVLQLNVTNQNFNDLLLNLVEDERETLFKTEYELEKKQSEPNDYYLLTIQGSEDALFIKTDIDYKVNPVEPTTESVQIEETTNTPSVEKPAEVVTDSKTTIHFIDTGQSDSILIENSGKYALIDAGDRDDDYAVKSYLTSQGVKRLEYLIVTHYHADHFGGADTVVNDFEVGKTFVPNGNADTQVYRDFIYALSNKGLAGSVPVEGAKVPLGNATLTFYNTHGGNSNENNNSLVVLLESGNKRALFTGDAEAEVERTLTNIGDVDLFKVAHHGSNTSNSQSLINQIKPEYAVVMVGEGNKYGHPNQEVMDYFKQLGIPVYRTDEQGTIIATLTNSGITINKQPGSYNPGSSYSSSNSSSSSSSSSSSGSTSSSNNSSSSSSSTSQSSNSSGVKVYQNCKLLNQDYPNGINQWDHPDLYAANTGRDRDKDGYACEK